MHNTPTINFGQKAELFAKHLENIFQPNEENDLEDWSYIYQDEIKIKFFIPKRTKRRSKKVLILKKSPTLIWLRENYKHSF